MELQTRTITITAAQLTTLVEHPITLLEGPGAGFATLILAMVASLEFGGAQFVDPGTGATSAAVCYGGPSQFGAAVSGLVSSADLHDLLTTSTASAAEFLDGPATTLPRTEIEAAPIFLCNPFAEGPLDFTGGGTSTLKITMFFFVVAL